MSTCHDQEVLKQILNPLMPSGDIKEIEEDAPIEHEGYEESRRLEKEGIVLADGKKDRKGAIEMFTRAIEFCPISPSPYNNRAQALQLTGKPDEALVDLNKAIELSKGKGRSACQAYTQRAMIHRLKDDKDAAKDDLEKAAALGSSFARMQLSIMNPYAAMCNAALAKVMGDLRQGKA